MMKERMLEIAKQSGLKKDHGSDREYVGDFDWRLFGDLIVKECVRHMNRRGVEGFGILEERNLLEHFGVEE
jgi:hypothetical protein